MPFPWMPFPEESWYITAAFFCQDSVAPAQGGLAGTTLSVSHSLRQSERVTVDLMHISQSVWPKICQFIHDACRVGPCEPLWWHRTPFKLSPRCQRNDNTVTRPTGSRIAAVSAAAAAGPAAVFAAAAAGPAAATSLTTTGPPLQPGRRRSRAHRK